MEKKYCFELEMKVRDYECDMHLLADRCQTLDEILPGVLAEVKPYEEQSE